MSPDTSTVTAYAATSATEPLTKTTITRRGVGLHDVRFDIHFAGICHSDIHTVRAEWGQPRYPVVPGHEIAGIVTEIGSAVTKFAVGDHVGVGCFVDSCRTCKNCKAGLQQYCTGGGMTGTYNAVPLHCCARASPPTRHCDTSMSARAPDSAWSDWAGWGTWRSNSVPRWVLR
jgi:D-arabinose 1-dehydrogenase-like Zn-dependent alcohol dehydrogenase